MKKFFVVLLILLLCACDGSNSVSMDKGVEVNTTSQQLIALLNEHSITNEQFSLINGTSFLNVDLANSSSGIDLNKVKIELKHWASDGIYLLNLECSGTCGYGIIYDSRARTSIYKTRSNNELSIQFNKNFSRNLVIQKLKESQELKIKNNSNFLQDILKKNPPKAYSFQANNSLKNVTSLKTIENTSVEKTKTAICKDNSYGTIELNDNGTTCVFGGRVKDPTCKSNWTLNQASKYICSI